MSGQVIFNIDGELIINNCVFENTGLVINYTNNDTDIEDSPKIFSNNVIRNCQSTALQVSDTIDVTIINSSITGSANNGILIEYINETGPTNVDVVNCNISDNAGRGVYINASGNGTWYANVLLSGCKIMDNINRNISFSSTALGGYIDIKKCSFSKEVINSTTWNVYGVEELSLDQPGSTSRLHDLKFPAKDNKVTIFFYPGASYNVEDIDDGTSTTIDIREKGENYFYGGETLTLRYIEDAAVWRETGRTSPDVQGAEVKFEGWQDTISAGNSTSVARFGGTSFFYRSVNVPESHYVKRIYIETESAVTAGTITVWLMRDGLTFQSLTMTSGTTAEKLLFRGNPALTSDRDYSFRVDCDGIVLPATNNVRLTLEIER
jgi:hypothetical protein